MFNWLIDLTWWKYFGAIMTAYAAGNLIEAVNVGKAPSWAFWISIGAMFVLGWVGPDSKTEYK